MQHVALCVKMIAAWYIPDVPQSVKNHILKKKCSDLRKELRWVMPREVPGVAGAAWPPAAALGLTPPPRVGQGDHEPLPQRSYSSPCFRGASTQPLLLQRDNVLQEQPHHP